MMLKRYRKIVILLISTSMLVTGGYAVASNFTGVSAEYDPIIHSYVPEMTDIIIPNERIGNVDPIVLSTVVSGDEDDIEPVYQGSYISIDGEKRKNDLYNFTTEQIETYMLEGYTIADLFEADAIANEWLIDPQVLLEKRKQTEDWTVIEQEARAERAQTLIEKNYKPKYPEEFEQLQTEKIDPETQLILMSILDRDRAKRMTDIIKDYKRSPQSFIESQADSVSISINDKEKTTLQRATNVDLNERVLEKLEELAGRSNQPLEQIVEQYKIAIKGVDLK